MSQDLAGEFGQIDHAVHHPFALTDSETLASQVNILNQQIDALASTQVSVGQDREAGIFKTSVGVRAVEIVQEKGVQGLSLLFIEVAREAFWARQGT